MRRLALSTCLAALLIACESNDAKLQRLEANVARADAHVASFRTLYWSPSLNLWLAKGAALDSIHAAERQSILAHRELDAFMAGR